jgi:hypothetical protein
MIITRIKLQQLILWRPSYNAFSPKCSFSLECQRVSNRDHRKRKKWKGLWIRDLGFRSGVNDSFILLDVTQRLLVINYRRFGTSYGSNLKLSSSPGTDWALVMGPTGCPETSVTTNLCCVTSQRSSGCR